MSRVLLHDHLDGGVRTETLNVLSGGEFPGYGDPNSGSLNSYLRVFNDVVRCMQDRHSLEIVARHAVEDLRASGIRYFEIRFAPALHTSGGLSVPDILESVASGIRTGIGTAGDIRGGIIVCAMRGRDASEMTKNMRFVSGIKEVVGLDLAGDERLGYLADYGNFFKSGRDKGLGVTIHAGETGDWRNVLEAVSMGATRIGHGVAIQHAPNSVRREIERAGVCFEMCPSSNLHTGVIEHFLEHPILYLLRSGFKVTINTDNRSVSKTTLEKEFSIVESMGATSAELVQMEANAADSVFADDSTKYWVKSVIGS